MVNINLKIDHTEEKKEISPITGGIILGVILLLLIIVYGGILFYKSRIDKEAELANAEYGAKLEEFKAGKAKNVFDFQNRLNNVISLANEKEEAGVALDNIEETILADVYMDSLEYDRDKKEIKLSLNAKNFNGMARQLLSFKNSGNYSDIQVGASAIKEKLVNFPVTLLIK